MVGLVIDDGARDIAALRARQFPIFTRGVLMRGTVKASAPSVGRPITFAGTPCWRRDKPAPTWKPR